MQFKSNRYWYYPNIFVRLNNSTAGKYIGYIRCNNHTTEEERTTFFETLFFMVQQQCDFPITAKMGFLINPNNAIPILFYCDLSHKSKLYSIIKATKTTIQNQYPQWFEKKDKFKTLTWSWYWKSNQQTLEEIQNGSHWTYKRGLRKK